MANSFFRFKQFTVYQENCAMKVCTDSCILGAYAAQKIEKKIIDPKTILDIGSGTGLLSLMLAQKSNAKIDAVEINTDAFHQMKKNFRDSPWSSRLNAFNIDIKDFFPNIQYGLIISNPPFFENDLKGDNDLRSIAMHDKGLKLSQLIEEIHRLIKPGGNFIVLIARFRIEDFKELIREKGGYIFEEMAIRQTPTRDLFRNIIVGGFYKKQEKVLLKEMTIKENDCYPQPLIELLKDYYEKL